MGRFLAIDFGTTNTVLASRPAASGRVQVVGLPDLSRLQDGYPPVVPSLVYVRDGQSGQVTLGQAVVDEGLSQHGSQRLFRNFKRGILAEAAPVPRLIDGALWSEREAAERFLRQVFESLP